MTGHVEQCESLMHAGVESALHARGCDGEGVCAGDACSHCGTNTPGFWYATFSDLTDCGDCVDIDDYTTTIKGMGGITIGSIEWTLFLTDPASIEIPQDGTCTCRWEKIASSIFEATAHGNDSCTDSKLNVFNAQIGVEVGATTIKVWAGIILPNDDSVGEYIGFVFYAEFPKTSCAASYTNIANSLVAGDCGNAMTITTDCGDDVSGVVLGYGGTLQLTPCRDECLDSVRVTIDADTCAGCVNDGVGGGFVDVDADGTYTVPKVTGGTYSTITFDSSGEGTYDSQTVCGYFLRVGEQTMAVGDDWNFYIQDCGNPSCSPCSGSPNYHGMGIVVVIYKKSRGIAILDIGIAQSDTGSLMPSGSSSDQFDRDTAYPGDPMQTWLSSETTGCDNAPSWGANVAMASTTLVKVTT